MNNSWQDEKNPKLSIKMSMLSLFGILGVLITVFCLLLLLWQLRNLVVTLMIAIVLAAALSPIINGAEKLGIPRWLAVLVVYLALIAGLMGIGLILGPTIVTQTQRLAVRLPGYLEEIRLLAEQVVADLGVGEPQWVDQFIDPQALTSWVIGSGQQVLVRSVGLTRGIVGTFLSLVLAVLISGYMLADSQTLIEGWVNLFPHPWNNRLRDQTIPVSQRMGGYIQGRVGVSAILGIATTLGLRLLGLSEFALALGMIAGLTNLIPFVGPILGALPALVVAASEGGWVFVWVFVLFVILQNLETYVLDPVLVGSSVKVHPLYQLLAVLGGTQVLGIVGALIVPPWVAGTAVMVENLYLQPKLEAEHLAAHSHQSLNQDSSTEKESCLETLPQVKEESDP
jgi:predicted PurR-regulated permease PerM